MRYELSPAKEGDLDVIIDAQFRSFAGLGFHEAFFGHDGPKTRAICKERHLKAMREGPADIWMKITDPDNGRIVCGANWKLYPQRAPPQQKDVEAFWFEGEDRQTTGYFIRDFIGRRQSHTGHPHLSWHGRV